MQMQVLRHQLEDDCKKLQEELELIKSKVDYYIRSLFYFRHEYIMADLRKKNREAYCSYSGKPRKATKMILK